MGKIVAQLFVSLDGVIESPERWHLDYWSDEMQAAVASEIEVADTLVLGRKTYDIFAASWPQRGSDVLFADRINSMPKVVVSSSRPALQWRNTTLVGDDVAEELTRRKRPAGAHLTISGSPTLVRSLLREGVLDELQLLVHPVVVGGGMRLLQDPADQKQFTLIDATTFKTGVLYLTYAPLPSAPAEGAGR